jgi:hypothetical protein
MQDARTGLIARLRDHARACQQRADSISSGYKSIPWTERARDVAAVAEAIREALSSSAPVERPRQEGEK